MVLVSAPLEPRQRNTTLHATPHVAFKTWEAHNETLESVEARIHDGAPVSLLKERAAAYLQNFHSLFPDLKVPANPSILEIGSGVGYIKLARSICASASNLGTLTDQGSSKPLVKIISAPTTTRSGPPAYLPAAFVPSSASMYTL